MTPAIIIITILAYFATILAISWFTGRKADNAGFFSGNRRQSWHVVAFAMIGSAMSGVTFVSVPGMVAASGFGYMQMTLGFIAGQLVIAFVLVPLFYKMNLVSIYGYLENRFGISSYRTGAWFFFISKMLGASVRLYLVCIALQLMVFTPLGVPFNVNVLVTVLVLLAYTYRGGVKAVIWIDFLKTFCMLVSIILCTIFISKALGFTFGSMCHAVADSGMSRIFYFDDPDHPQYFFKQFFGGMFTLIAMTGLDQAMMQKNLACKDLKSAQKNMYTTSVIIVVANLFFLLLGALLCVYTQKLGGLEALGVSKTDEIFPAIASRHFGVGLGIFFLIGLISASYPSAGAALTSLTTSVCVDFLGKNDDKIRRKVQALLTLLFLVMLVALQILSSDAVINLVYKLASYTYGPLLGLFFFGILTRRKVRDRATPFVAAAAPLICLAVNLLGKRFLGFDLGFSLLVVNGLLTFAGLWIFSKKEESL